MLPARTARPLRIALIGNYGSGNLGNDGSLEAVLGVLRGMAPGAEIACVCSNPEVVAERYGLPTLPMRLARPVDPRLNALDKALLRIPRAVRNWAHALAVAGRFDAFVVPGTGVMDDFGEGPRGMPSMLRRWVLAARLRGASFSFVSIGAGPIRHPVSRLLFGSCVRWSSYRSFRDQFSKDYLARLGLPVAGDPVFPDVAFLLPKPPAPAPRASPRPVVALGAMSYFGWNNDRRRGRPVHEVYRAKLVDLALRLLDSGCDLRLLVGEDTDEPTVAALRAAILQARPRLDPSRVEAPEARSLHDIMRQMADAGAVIGTRFHTVLCGLHMGRPTVALGYSERHHRLMQDMGVEAYSFHVESFDVDVVAAQVEALLSEPEDALAPLRVANAEVQRRLARQNEVLRRALLGEEAPVARRAALPKGVPEGR